MKIAIATFLFNEVNGGGAARSTMILADQLERMGHELVIITTGTREQVKQIGKRTIYTIVPLNLYWVGHKDEQPIWKRMIWQTIDIWNPSVYAKMLRILQSERPDLVHVNKLRGLSPAVWTAAHRQRIPVIQTCRDYELMSPEGTLTGQLGKIAEEGRWPLVPYQIIRRQLTNQVAAVTSPSQYTLKKLTDAQFFAKSAKYVVSNSHGLNDQQLEKQKVQITSRSHQTDKFRVLYLGRVEQTKGIDFLCQAVENIAEDRSDLHLDVVGTGTYLAALVERYGDKPWVTFHGAQFGEAKDNLILASTVQVVPSTWPEVFGIVIAEAYSWGKPVIGASVGGIPELITPETGLLTAPGDVDALQRAIVQLYVEYRQGDLARREAACITAAHRFNVESVASNYLQVYQDVLAF